MSRIALTLFAVLGLAFLSIPLAVVVLGGLTTDAVLRMPIPGFTLRWVGDVFRDKGWVDAFCTSTSLAVCASLSATVIGVAAAVGLSGAKSRSSAIWREALIAPLIFPYVVLGTAMLQTSAAVGFMQTFFALVIGHTVIAIPFVLQSTLPLLSAKHRILEEASADLGASPWCTLWRITLPLIRPGIFAGAIFGFIFSWTNVEMSMFQTTSTLMTLPVKIYNYVQYQVDPLIAAISGVMIVVSAAFLILIELTFGLTAIAKPGSDRRKS